MAKSESKAREENVSLRRANRELQSQLELEREKCSLLAEKVSLLEKKLDLLSTISEVNHDSQLHA